MNLLLMKGADDAFPSVSGASIYKAAVENCSAHMMSGTEPKLTIFDMSTYLAISFGIIKEKTYNDLLEANQARMS